MRLIVVRESPIACASERVDQWSRPVAPQGLYDHPFTWRLRWCAELSGAHFVEAVEVRRAQKRARHLPTVTWCTPSGAAHLLVGQPGEGPARCGSTSARARLGRRAGRAFLVCEQQLGFGRSVPAMIPSRIADAMMRAQAGQSQAN